MGSDSKEFISTQCEDELGRVKNGQMNQFAKQSSKGYSSLGGGDPDGGEEKEWEGKKPVSRRWAIRLMRSKKVLKVTSELGNIKNYHDQIHIQ